MTPYVIVTGASSGIGKATACLLAGSGCKVVLTARRKDLLEAVAEGCPEGATQVIPADISRGDQCDQLIAQARATSGEVRPVLVNAAGVAEFGPFSEMPFASFERQLELNLTGPARLCHAVIPWMLEAGGGQIINVLSVAAVHVFNGAAGYAASKAGFHMFSKVLAEEFRGRGIRVTSLLPGSVDTPLWDSQNFVPNRPDMLPVTAVAETIRDLVFLPEDRNIDEIQLMPPKGIL